MKIVAEGTFMGSNQGLGPLRRHHTDGYSQDKDDGGKKISGSHDRPPFYCPGSAKLAMRPIRLLVTYNFPTLESSTRSIGNNRP